MILNGELNYEEENKKLQLFLKKQEERIKKLREKCNCREASNNSCETKDDNEK